jgi:MFS family permease
VTDVSAPSHRASPWRALAHRNFALFFTGHGLSLCGTWMQSMAQAWLVYRLTGSPLLLGVTEFLSRAPILALAPLSGVLADRWPRRRIMILAQSLLLVQAAVLAALTLSGLVTIWWILGLALAQGLISALEVPVRQTFLTDLVPRRDIPSAIGLNSSIFNSSRIIGPSAAGLLVSTAGEGICFLLNAGSFLIVLVALAMIRIKQTRHDHATDAWGLLKEGLHYGWRTPHVRALLTLTGIISIASMPYATLLPVFARDILQIGPDGLGLLMAATGLGALTAALLLARRNMVLGLGTSIALAVACFGTCLLALAASSILWVSLPALYAIGFGMVSSLAGCNTLLQSLAPDPMRGRVVSLFTTASLGLTVFGSLLAGSGATCFGAPPVVAVGGLLTIGASIWFWRALPAIRAHVHEHKLMPADEVPVQ